jgi:uncharacterized membrane protein HdeD (DUF308 family)
VAVPVLGILWILFGMFVLSYNVGSLLALAVFAGVTFVMTGITQVLAAGRVDSWKWLYLVGAVKAGLQRRAAASAGVPDSSDRGDAGPAAKP